MILCAYNTHDKIVCLDLCCLLLLYVYGSKWSISVFGKHLEKKKQHLQSS